MSIENLNQLENTRRKLKLLEDRLAALDKKPVTNPKTHALTKQSLRRLANQFIEEIVTFQSRQSSGASRTTS